MRKFLINVNGNSYEVEVEEVTDGQTSVAPASTRPALTPTAPAPTPAPAPVQAASKPSVSPEPVVSLGQEVIDSPMPGNIWKILVSEGDMVKSGDTLVILEAMKMENELVAPRDGKVLQILTSEGTSVNTGDKLVIIE